MIRSRLWVTLIFLTACDPKPEPAPVASAPAAPMPSLTNSTTKPVPKPAPKPEPQLTKEIAATWTADERAARLRKDCYPGAACYAGTLEPLLDAAADQAEKRELDRIQATHEVPLYVRLRAITSEAQTLEKASRGLERDTAECRKRRDLDYVKVSAWRKEQERMASLPHASSVGSGLHLVMNCVGCAYDADDSCRWAAQLLKKTARILMKQEQDLRKKL